MRYDINSLGYPDCCVEAFPHESNRDNIFVGTGFLPCNECAKRNPRELLEAIVERRTHPKPFPHAFGNHILFLLDQEMLNIIYDIYEVDEVWRVRSHIRKAPTLPDISGL